MVIVQTDKDVVLARWKGSVPRVGDNVQLLNGRGGMWRVISVEWVINVNAAHDGDVRATVVIVEEMK